MNKKKQILAVGIVLLVAALIRLYNLAKESFWKDEALTVLTSSQSNITDLIKNLVLIHQNHPPLYFLLLHYWGNIFGFSEFSMRFISVIFSLGIVFMVYLLSKEIFENKTAIIAMLLSALSITNLIYSQEAKQYSMLGFFVLLSTYFLVRFLKSAKKKQRQKFLTLYFISSILMFYTHHIGLIVFFLQNLFLILFERKNFLSKRTIIWELICFVLYLPLILLIIWAFSNGQHDVISLMLARNFPLFIAKLGYLNLLWVVVFFILLSLVFYLNFRSTKKLVNSYKNFENIINKRKNSILNACLFLIVVLYALGSVIIGTKFLHPYFITKYPFFIFAFVHILLARLIVLVFKRKFVFISLAVILLINIALIMNFYSANIKSEWRDATEIIRENIKNNDFIVYPGGDNIAPFLYYFPAKPFNYSDIPYDIYSYFSMTKFTEKELRAPEIQNPEAFELIKEKMKEKNGGIWVVHYYRYQLREPFDEFAQKNLKLQYENNFEEDNRLIIQYYTLN